MHLGASGAALGTTISQTFSVVIAVLSIRKKSGVSLKKCHFIAKRQVLRAYLKDWCASSLCRMVAFRWHLLLLRS